MSFDTASFCKFSSDPRFDIFSKPINLDQDLKANEITWIAPATAKTACAGFTDPTVTVASPTGGTATTFSSGVTVGSANYSCYNNNNDLHYFDIYLGSDFKSAMYSTALEMTFFGRQARGPITGITCSAATGALTINAGTGNIFDGVPCIAGTASSTILDASGYTFASSNGLNVTGTATSFAITSGTLNMLGGSSVSWNPMSFFQTYSLLINQQQQVMEQYTNVGTLNAISTAKYLQKYKLSALENNDMTFLTPCIESAFDTKSTLSLESAKRTIQFGVGNSIDASSTTNTTNKKRKLIIPLSDMFESLETEGILVNNNRFRLQFTMNTPDKIAFGTSQRIFNSASSPSSSGWSYEGQLYIYVDDVKLINDSARVQAGQSINMNEEKQKGRVENIGFLQNYGVNTPYSAGQQLVLTSQRDVQSIIVGFPAIGSTVNGSTGINPCQFYHGCVNTLQPAYGNDLPLKTPLRLSQSNPYAVLENTAAYYLYRKNCNAEEMRELPLALNFNKYQFYHFYYLPIYSPMSIHRNNDPKDIRVDTSIGTSDTNYGSASNVFIIARKLQGAQLLSDGSIASLSQ